MSYLAPLWHLFWFARVLFLLVLLAVVIRRRSYQRFPIFVAYIGWSAFASVALVAMNYAPSVTGNQYLLAFLIDGAVVTVLGFAIIHELFAARVRPYPALRAFGTSAFRWTTVFLLVIAVALAWFAPSRDETHPMATFDVLQRTVDTLQCGLLVFLFGFCAYFRLSWRSHAFGIAVGLGTLISVNLATAAIRSQIEPATPTLGSNLCTLVSEASNLGCVLLWLAYILSPERPQQPVVRSLPEYDLENWNQELRRFLQQ